jgi:hypothetical protein
MLVDMRSLSEAAGDLDSFEKYLAEFAAATPGEVPCSQLCRPSGSEGPRSKPARRSMIDSECV